MEDKDKKKKRYLLVVAFLLIIFTVAGASYALFTYSRLGETNTTITSGDIEFSYLEGKSVTLENAFPVSDTVGAADTANMYEFTVKMSSSSSKVNAVYNVSLLTDNTGTNNFKNKEVKYNLEKNNNFVVGTSTTGSLVSTIEGFDDEQTSGIGTVLTNQEISANQTDKYKLRIWIDENVNYSGDIDSNGTMTGTKNSYTYSLKVKVDSTTSIQTTVKPGIATTSLKTYAITEDGTKELRIDEHTATGNQTFASTDYRYYGATPNNYVTFNNETWRIIGVMTVENEFGTLEERVKIIRNTPIGSYSWDSSESTVNGGWGVNEWSQSDIKTLLNDTYYNAKSGTCYTGSSNYTIACNFTTIGLTENARSMISSVTWYTSASDYYDITSSQFYEAERGTAIGKICSSDEFCNDTVTRTNTWVGEVGLIYPSDYGYAADMKICSTTKLNSYASSCKSSDWLFTPYQWTMISRADSSFATRIYIVHSTGNAYYGGSGYTNLVRPVTYLASDIAIASGTGTSSDPFTLTR